MTNTYNSKYKLIIDVTITPNKQNNKINKRNKISENTSIESIRVFSSSFFQSSVVERLNSRNTKSTLNQPTNSSDI